MPPSMPTDMGDANSHPERERRNGQDAPAGGHWLAEADEGLVALVRRALGGTPASHMVTFRHGCVWERSWALLLLLPLPLRIGRPPLARLSSPGRFLDTGCALEGGARGSS